MTPLVPGTTGFVERLLADRIGLDVASVGESLIHRGVEVRMKQLGVRRREDYERILLGPSDEVQALIEEVVIPESWFFRDERPFATFREFVRTGWVDQPRRQSVSVLCLPCASGEEPYSVAIALLELGLPRERFEVVAVDVSVQSIRRATAGLYSSNAFRGMDPRLQNEYFEAKGGRFQLKPVVRTAVRFEQGNILDPTLLGAEARFNVVFCRNLLIYFDSGARTKAFANLDRLTQSGGLLFLGHADRADQDAGSRFTSFADAGSFVYQKQDPQRVASVAPSGKAAAATSRKSQPKPAPQLQPSPSPALARSPARTHSPPGPRAEVAAPSSPQPQGKQDCIAVLEQASTLANQGRYAEATRLVRQELSQVASNAAAHFLLGIVEQAAGNVAEAEAELTKAIYLDPEHDEALLAMALLARRKGDMAAEAFYRRRADRVLARKGRS